MIVQMMNGSVHESEAALQGYLSFFHLFLALVSKHPELQEEVDGRVAAFLQAERGRNKRACPNLGEFMACLACSSYSWKQVGVAVLGEVFDRNVKWVVMQFPELVDLRQLQQKEDELAAAASAPAAPPPAPAIAEVPVAGLSKAQRRRLRSKKADAWAKILRPVAAAAPAKRKRKGKDESEAARANKLDRGRLPKTWQATQVSCRLIMFHVLFLRMFRLAPARPTSDEAGDEAEGSEGGEMVNVSIAAALQTLNRSYGRATHTLSRQFQRGVKRILAVNDWEGFFQRGVLLPDPGCDFLCLWLQRAALNSARKRYHNPDAIKQVLLEAKQAKRKEREEARRRADPMSFFDEEERVALEGGDMSDFMLGDRGYHSWQPKAESIGKRNDKY
jgi:hypothetical protein